MILQCKAVLLPVPVCVCRGGGGCGMWHDIDLFYREQVQLWNSDTLVSKEVARECAVHDGIPVILSFI